MNLDNPKKGADDLLRLIGCILLQIDWNLLGLGFEIGGASILGMGALRPRLKIKNELIELDKYRTGCLKKGKDHLDKLHTATYDSQLKAYWRNQRTKEETRARLSKSIAETEHTNEIVPSAQKQKNIVRMKKSLEEISDPVAPKTPEPVDINDIDVTLTDIYQTDMIEYTKKINELTLSKLSNLFDVEIKAGFLIALGLLMQTYSVWGST